MAEILNIESLLKETPNIKKNGRLVLVGGCFDILHVGHIKFLQEAKRMGDRLLVLLESDERVKKLKGSTRPYFPQEERAAVLASLSCVDYVILLPFFSADEEYNKLIVKIYPAIIAVTSKDPIFDKKKKQAEMIGGRIEIIPYVKTFSSSQIAKLIGME